MKDNYREIFTSLLWRLVPALGIGALGWFLLASAKGGWGALPQLLFGMACLMTAATIIAPPIARLMAEPTGNLYYPAGTFDRPQPMYSIGEAKRKKGLHQEAFHHFADIAREFPHELEPYVAMIDLAIVDMKNRALAEQVFQQGMSSLASEQNRLGLCAMYKAITSRLIQDAPNHHPPIKVKQQVQNPASATLETSPGAGSSAHQGWSSADLERGQRD